MGLSFRLFTGYAAFRSCLLSGISVVPGFSLLFGKFRSLVPGTKTFYHPGILTFSGIALHLFEHRNVMSLHQINGRSLPSGSGRATDAVHINIGCSREIEIDNMGNIGNVNTSGRHICGNKNSDRAVGKSPQPLQTFFLIHLTPEV